MISRKRGFPVWHKTDFLALPSDRLSEVCFVLQVALLIALGSLVGSVFWLAVVSFDGGAM
jgi:hypothetical protein